MLKKLASKVGGSLGHRILEYLVNVNEYSIKYTHGPCVQWNYLDVFSVNAMLDKYVQYPNITTDDKLTTPVSTLRNLLLYYSDNHRIKIHNGVNMLVVERKIVICLY